VRVFEKFDVRERGSFFDGVGALRDVGQNHMLQMLALVAMDRPASLDTATLRATRADVLRALVLPTEAGFASSVVKGQYAEYRATAGVAPDSRTETYFALKAHLDLPAWQGVPWYLEHGKAMERSVSDITIRFRSARACACGDSAPHEHPNFVRFSISPEQKITIRFWVRTPGTAYELSPEDLVFDREQAVRDGALTIADAYEEVLFSAICGDQTLFVSSAEQAAAWTYVTHLLDMWKDTEPEMYDVGSEGPESELKEEITRLFTV